MCEHGALHLHSHLALGAPDLLLLVIVGLGNDAGLLTSLAGLIEVGQHDPVSL